MTKSQHILMLEARIAQMQELLESKERECAAKIAAANSEYQRMKSENAKLLEKDRDMHMHMNSNIRNQVRTAIELLQKI